MNRYSFYNSNINSIRSAVCGGVQWTQRVSQWEFKCCMTSIPMTVKFNASFTLCLGFWFRRVSCRLVLCIFIFYFLMGFSNQKNFILIVISILKACPFSLLVEVEHESSCLVLIAWMIYLCVKLKTFCLFLF